MGDALVLGSASATRRNHWSIAWASACETGFSLWAGRVAPPMFSGRTASPTRAVPAALGVGWCVTAPLMARMTQVVAGGGGATGHARMRMS